MLIGLTVAGRIAMRGFYERACGRAFAQWEANPSLGESVDALLLAELAGLTPQDAWNTRQFLERKAAVIGLGYQEAGEPNHRRYRFPGRQTVRLQKGENRERQTGDALPGIAPARRAVRCDGGRGIGEHLRRGGPARLRRAVALTNSANGRAGDALIGLLVTAAIAIAGNLLLGPDMIEPHRPAPGRYFPYMF